MAQSESLSKLIGGGGSDDDDLDREICRACAGPLVDVPRATERVFYFPQGHMEQLQATTNQELNQQIPRFNPPQILSVMNIRLTEEIQKETIVSF